MKPLTQQFWWFALAGLVLLWLPSTLLRLGAGHPLYSDPRFDGQRFLLENRPDKTGDGGTALLEFLGVRSGLRLENLSALGFAQLANATSLGGRWYRTTAAQLEQYKPEFVVLMHTRYTLVESFGTEYVGVVDPFLGQMVYPKQTFLAAWEKNGNGQVYAFGKTQKVRGGGR
jgi:predicted double-glycine peptidase